MPQIVICHKCGTTLFESEDQLKPLEDIIQMYDGRCPACKKRLSSLPKNIEVKLVNVPNRLNPFEPKKEKPSRRKSWSGTKKRFCTSIISPFFMECPRFVAKMRIETKK
jgi:hypothetical protein